MIKYLEINLTKLVTDLYSQNYETLMKGIEDDANKCKDSHAHRLEGPILLKFQNYPKQSTH